MSVTMKFSLTKALFVVLMMAGVSTEHDDDPYLQDVAATSATGNLTDDEIFREFFKIKLLEGLGIAEPPIITKRPTNIGEDVRNFLNSHYLDVKDSEKRDQPGSEFSSAIIFGESGSNSFCRISESRLRNHAAISFKLPNDPSLIRRAFLQFKEGTRRTRTIEPEMGIRICHCSARSSGDKNGTWSAGTMADSEAHDTSCQRLSINDSRSSVPEVSTASTRNGWNYVQLQDNWKSFVSSSSGTDKRLLFLFDGEPRDVELLRSSLVVQVEKEILRTKRYPLRMKRSDQILEHNDCSDIMENEKRMGSQNTDSPLPCCRSSFWIDFKDLGWDDWIISPKRMKYHFCTGECKHGFDSIVKGGVGLDYSKVINAMIEKQKIKNIRPCCSPRKMEPLNIVIADGNNTAVVRHIPDFVVAECACIGFAATNQESRD